MANNISKDTVPRRIKSLYKKQRELASELHGVSWKLAQYHMVQTGHCPSTLVQLLFSGITLCLPEILDTDDPKVFDGVTRLYAGLVELSRALPE